MVVTFSAGIRTEIINFECPKHASFFTPIAIKKLFKDFFGVRCIKLYRFVIYLFRSKLARLSKPIKVTVNNKKH